MRELLESSPFLPFFPPALAEESPARHTPKPKLRRNLEPKATPSGHTESPSHEPTENPVLSLAFCATPRSSTSAIDTLADVMERFEDANALRGARGPVRRRLARMRTTTKHLAAYFARPLDAIRLEELIGIDEKITTFLGAMKCGESMAACHLRNKRTLLALAKELGWSSKLLEVSESWTPILDALRGKKAREATIIECAIRHNIPASRFGEPSMMVWRREMKARGRASDTIRNSEFRFRGKLREAKLHHLLPNLDLSVTRPRYRRNGSRTAELEADINAKVEWKTGLVLAKRDRDYRIRPETGEQLRYILRRVADYAECELGMKGIRSLKEILVPTVLLPMVDWLRDIREAETASIETDMVAIHAY